MAQFEYWMTTDLKRGSSQVQAIHGQTFSQDNLGNRVGVVVLDGGEPATLSGTVSGYVIRADGGTVVVVGALDGNKAYIDLPESAYAVPGQIQIAIRLTSGETKTVLGALNAYVQRTATGTIIDPGHVVPDIDDIIAKMDEVDEAIDNAEAATTAANTAAQNANNATGYIAVTETTSTASAAHAQGSYLIYDGKLYKVTADIAIGENLATTGDGANIAQVTGGAMGEVADLKSALVIPSGLNLYNKDDNTVGKNITSSGEIEDSTNFDISDWIFCPKGKYVIRAFDVQGAPNYTVSIYNNQKTFWKRDVSVAANYPDGVTFNFNVDRYVRITVPTAGKANQLNQLVFMAGDAVDSYVPYYTANDIIARKAVSELPRNISNLMLDTVENSSISKSTGNFYYESGTNRTTFIDCSGFVNLIYYTEVQSTSNAFYDENKEFISAFPMLVGLLNNNYRFAVVPDNAKYFVLSNTPAGLASTKIMPVSEIPGVQKIGVYSGLAYSASASDIKLETQGTDIIATFPSQWYVDIPLIRGNVTSRTIRNATSFTVPANRYLVYNDSTKTVSVMAFADIQAISANIPLVVLMYNDYGRAVGMLSPYQFTPDIPSYYDSYMSTKADTINTIKAGTGLDGFSFVFISDEHVQANRMQSPKLIKYIRENTGIDTIINGGDIFTYYGTKAEAYRGISNFVALMANTGDTMYSIIGNHEFNNPNASSTEEAMAKTLSLAEVSAFLYTGENYTDCVFNTEQMTYYKDFGKLRVFFLPCNYASGVYLNAVKWILNQFQSVPSGYSVMVAAHVLIDNMSNLVLNARVQGLANGMDALKVKTVYTYEGVTYDYTNTNTTPICIIGGHSHTDYSTATNGGVPIILTTCDAYQQEDGSLTRTPYTTGEQAFDVVTINYNARKINLTRIGAGNDREFSY